MILLQQLVLEHSDDVVVLVASLQTQTIMVELGPVRFGGRQSQPNLALAVGLRRCGLPV